MLSCSSTSCFKGTRNFTSICKESVCTILFSEYIVSTFWQSIKRFSGLAFRSLLVFSEERIEKTSWILGNNSSHSWFHTSVFSVSTCPCFPSCSNSLVKLVYVRLSFVVRVSMLLFVREEQVPPEILDLGFFTPFYPARIPPQQN